MRIDVKTVILLNHLLYRRENFFVWDTAVWEVDWTLEVNTGQCLEMPSLRLFKEYRPNRIIRLREKLVFDGMHHLRFTDTFLSSN